jgi:tetratricopeptide (TPR) repeat protein
MQAAANTNRFLTGCSSSMGLADLESVVGNNDFLRHILASRLIQTVTSQELFLKLTNSLIQFAEQAYLRRDLDALEEISRVLMNLPIDAARQIGLYYHALTIKRKGHLDEAQTLLETVADKAPLNYRARATQGLGANYHDKGQLNEALRFQLEALRMASDKTAHGLQTTLLAHGEIAIVRSLDGDHHGALADLEKLWPLFYHVAKQNPFYFYVFNNELAVELGEAGRIEEAEAACKIALASPFASAYPEWAETRQELEAKRTSATPSVVAINHTSEAIPAAADAASTLPKA